MEENEVKIFLIACSPKDADKLFTALEYRLVNTQEMEVMMTNTFLLQDISIEGRQHRYRERSSTRKESSQRSVRRCTA